MIHENITNNSKLTIIQQILQQKFIKFKKNLIFNKYLSEKLNLINIGINKNI